VRESVCALCARTRAIASSNAVAIMLSVACCDLSSPPLPPPPLSAIWARMTTFFSTLSGNDPVSCAGSSFPAAAVSEMALSCERLCVSVKRESDRERQRETARQSDRATERHRVGEKGQRGHLLKQTHSPREETSGTELPAIVSQ
jgi:hypothetical protein